MIFFRNLLHMKKPALGVGLIGPKKVIDSLVLKLHMGNKSSQGELKTVISMHEEISAEDSGLPTSKKKGL